MHMISYINLEYSQRKKNIGDYEMFSDFQKMENESEKLYSPNSNEDIKTFLYFS